MIAFEDILSDPRKYRVSEIVFWEDANYLVINGDVDVDLLPILQKGQVSWDGIYHKKNSRIDKNVCTKMVHLSKVPDSLKDEKLIKIEY